MSRIVLIHSPCTMPDKPYISLAVLAPFLRSKGIHASVLDANIEFFRRFLSEKHFAYVSEYVRERISAMTAQQERNDQEEQDLLHLTTANKLLQDKEFIEKLGQLFNENSLANTERFGIFRKVLAVASLPYHPEQIDFLQNTNYVRYVSRLSRFSSQDIWKSLQQSSLFTPFLEEILSLYIQEKMPNIVGISVTFPDQIVPAFHCAKIIKNISPAVHITFGGASISSHFRDVTNLKLFDYVDSFILDEGEIPLVILAKEMEKAPQDREFREIPSLIYLDHGTIVKNTLLSPPEMETSFQVDYSAFPLDRYLIPRNKMALLFRLSKGCFWAKCTFCKINLPLIHNHYQPEARILYSYLKAMIERTGVHIIHFSDDSASPEVLEDLSKRIIAEGIHLQWTVNLRIERRVTLRRLILFNQAGCRSICFGVECYSDRILKLMRKGITLQMIDKILADVSLVGIPVTLYMIVGFPGESTHEAKESFYKICDFIKKGLIRSCIYNVFEIAPFSAIHADPLRFGIHAIAEEKKKDLNPPNTHFSSVGMSREEANELCLEFIQQLKRTLSQTDASRQGYP